MEENIALERKKQNKFSKKVKAIKEQVTGPELIQNVKNKGITKERGLVYVGHIPHGFYEKEMLTYFKQFGKVSNLRVCRSDKTGRSKGYAFVEFANAEVAKIAASTMDNYLMFNRRLEAKFVSPKSSKRLRRNKIAWSVNKYPLQKVRKLANKLKNRKIDEEEHLVKSQRLMKNVNKSLQKLQKLGINYNFQPIDVPKELDDDRIKLITKKLRQSKKNLKHVGDKVNNIKNENNIEEDIKRVIKREKKVKKK